MVNRLLLLYCCLVFWSLKYTHSFVISRLYNRGVTNYHTRQSRKTHNRQIQVNKLHLNNNNDLFSNELLDDVSKTCKQTLRSIGLIVAAASLGIAIGGASSLVTPRVADLTLLSFKVYADESGGGKAEKSFELCLSKCVFAETRPPPAGSDVERLEVRKTRPEVIRECKKKCAKTSEQLLLGKPKAKKE